MTETEIIGAIDQDFRSILSPGAIAFVGNLEKRLGPKRLELLQRREKIQAQLDDGGFPDFLKETQSIRQSNWKVAPTPSDLLDRRVEITGPVDRKMVINALNSGAKVFMADFEDSHSPTWDGTIRGQINLYDAVRKNISFDSPEGKRYTLRPRTATLMVRPRGWHLEEWHLRLEGKPVSASLFDFGLFFYHNAKEQIQRGTGPYFYLPKMESHLEARLWNEVFNFAQDQLGIPRGTIKATVLIETILASFEMDEILYELREHSAGLNCGRWDYIFSFIKKFRHRQEPLPDRHQITMGSHFLKSYSELVIKTCHRRGAHAMGGMAAQIPIKNNPKQNEAAMERVRADKLREVTAGHDGTWVAHPGLVPIAQEIFDAHMPGPNQRENLRADVSVTAKDLLLVPIGTITEAGIRNNITVGVQYLESWLRGNGCVAIHHLMEDAATAEIARAQLWQWIQCPNANLGGQKINAPFFRKMLTEELQAIRDSLGKAYEATRFDLAARIFDQLTTSESFCEFLTVPAYAYLHEKGDSNEPQTDQRHRKGMEERTPLEKH